MIQTKTHPSQLNEHGVYVKGVKKIKIPMPSKAGKTEVEIRFVQDAKDSRWRSTYSAQAGTGGVSGPVMNTDHGFESREDAIAAAGDRAKSYLLSALKDRTHSDALKRQIEAGIEALDSWVASRTTPPPPPMQVISQGDIDVVEDELAPADPVAERMHKEALARWRREPGADDDDSPSNGYHPQMLQMIPLDQIEPSPTNPRKHFDQVKLLELADSIISHGLVEPILVRPYARPNEDGKLFSLVAGERRWRAAILAGLEMIEAKVRELDDKAVLEIQFIENLQRADLSPIEEAEGYKRLLDEHGYTAESLAARLGKSKSYVYGRVKICNLPEPALNALASGDLPATIGELIGRLPGMEMREEFWRDNFGDMGNEYFHMPSFRDVKLEIEREYMRELKKAPFPQADKKLLAGVPSCKDCPKRTGNNKADYPDSRADVCTDTGCFDRKVEAFNKRKLEAAATEGVRVLTEEESEKFLGYGFLRGEITRDFVDLEDECEEAGDPDNWEADTPTFAQLLGETVKAEVVGMSKGGKIHQLVSRKAAAEALAEKGIVLKDVVLTNPGALYKDEQKKQKELRVVRKQAAGEIVASILRDVDDSLFALDKFLRLVAKLLIEKGDAEVAREIGKRREVEIKPVDVRGSLVKIVDGLDENGVRELVVELLLSRELEYWALGMGGDKFPLCAYFGHDPKKTEKRIAGDRKREASEKEAAKKKSKSKPKLVIQA